MMSGTRLPIWISRPELALAIGLGCAALPMPAVAQTATPVDDQIKQLQNEIRSIQKHYETELRKLQRQLDDLKAAQAAPKPAPVPPTDRLTARLKSSTSTSMIRLMTSW